MKKKFTLLVVFLITMIIGETWAATITVNLKDGNGSYITSSASLRYNDGVWKTDATNNLDGTWTITTSAPSLYYEMTYNYGVQQIGPIPTTTILVTFQTVTTTVRLQDHNLGGLIGGVARYNQGSWNAFGTTGGSGNTPVVELLPGNYYFDIDYNYGHQQVGPLAVSGPSQTILFTTVGTTVRLAKSGGTGIAGGQPRYNQGSWNTLPLTDGSGNSFVELLPGNYYFDMAYNFGIQQLGPLALPV